ncbi:MAG TPA: efflux RND transporter periplasmic adaptor subunit [Acidobacteriaceae bacterium]|nr:efflux RND transporter periplasmic adaptor subunit [Acidobacteriaceae bacterium]
MATEMRNHIGKEDTVLKKILLIIGAVVVLGLIVGLTIVRAQSGYTKVLIGTVGRENLVSVVNATGQIRPKTYVNIGANAMGRVTNFYVAEGDHVKRGQIVATIENVQQEANVAAQQATIAAAQTDISSYVAAERTQQANLEHAQADLEQKKLDYDRAKALYAAQVMSQQNFDAAKAAYDLDVASVAQARAALAQSKAQTASAEGHLKTQQASLKVQQDLLNRTIAVAPFDGIVTNEPVRVGEMVVTGIQNTEGSTLMTLADMSVITAEVKVDETDIVNVKLGQPADVTVDALPGKVFKGHVTEVGDQALLRSSGVSTSQATSGVEEAKDFKVVVTLDGPADELRPGLSTTAKITTASKDNVVAIPIQALTMRDPKQLQTGGKPQVQTVAAATSEQQQAQPIQGVFIVRKEKGKDRVHFIPVTTGITGATDIEVTGGLQPGDRIVTGTYRVLRDLKEGALVKQDTKLAAPVQPSSST